MNARSTHGLRRRLAVVVATAVGLAGLVALAPAAGAATAVPPFEPDPSAYGTIAFYDAAGHQVTSGNITDKPFATYVVASADPDVPNPNSRIQLSGYLPVPNQQTAEFSGMTMSLNTKYPAVGAPANIAAITKPVATLNDTDFTLADLQSSYPNTAPAGSAYQGLYQLRLKTAASTGSVRWQRADIKITGSTWTQVLPDPSADTTAPVAAITSGPAAVTGSASATFAFGATDDTDTAVQLRLQCSLDGAAFAACTSPTTLTGLSSKRHTFAVRAVDRAGNVGAAVSRAWTVDRVAPTTTTGALPAVSLGSKVTVSARSADASSGVASRDFRYQKASYGGAFSAWSTPRGWGATKASSVSLTLARGYQFCVSARTRDRVGNVSAWTAARCTASPLDERSLTASKGWTKVSSSRLYARTGLRTTTANAALTRTKVRAKGAVVVATRCTSCGTVGVYWKGKLLKRISLKGSNRDQVQYAVTLGRTAGTGTLQLKSLTKGKRVQLDGLALLQR